MCIFRRKVMVPKNNYLEQRGGEQPGRPVPQPDKNLPGSSPALTHTGCANAGASGRITSISTMGTAKPTRSEPAPTSAGHHRAEQRADVVELVEPGDHRVDAGLALAGSAPRPGDPGRGGEAQRRDHRDPGAEQREAELRPPARSGRHDDGEGRATRRGAPTRSTGTAPNLRDQPVAGEAHRAAGHQVGERRQGDQPGGRREDVVEVDRSPGRGRPCRPCRRAPSRARPARWAATARRRAAAVADHPRSRGRNGATRSAARVPRASDGRTPRARRPWRA